MPQKYQKCRWIWQGDQKWEMKNCRFWRFLLLQKGAMDPGIEICSQKKRFWVVPCSDCAPNTLLSKAHRTVWFSPILRRGGEVVEEPELQKGGEPLPSCPGETLRLCAHSMKLRRAWVGTRTSPESPGQIRLPTCVPEAPHQVRLWRRGIPFSQIHPLKGHVAVNH